MKLPFKEKRPSVKPNRFGEESALQDSATQQLRELDLMMFWTLVWDVCFMPHPVTRDLVRNALTGEGPP